MGGADWDFYALRLNDFGDTLWTRKYGGTGHDWGHAVALTSDGGFIFAGETNPPAKIYLVRTNSNGDTIWTRTFDTGYDQEHAYSIQGTLDGAYIIAGNTRGPSPDDNAFLLKIDSAGNMLWTRIYNVINDQDIIGSVAVCPDSGYIITGNVYPPGYMLAIRTTSIGDTLWTRQYVGGSVGYSVEDCPEGGYIIVGRSSSIGGDPFDYDVYVIKINSTGDTLWTRTFGGTGWYDCGYSVQVNSDGGYIVAGSKTVGSDPYFYLARIAGRAVHVISPNGGEQWRIFETDTARWDTFGYEGHVDIELNRHYPCGSWETLAANTDNDGEETIWITDPLSDSCRVRVSSIPDSLSDISDSNFSMVSSQGYLALVGPSQLQIPIIAWNAGVVECPLTRSFTFRFKNFGNESITVYLPTLPIGPHFALIGSTSTFTLDPGQASAWMPTLRYDPLADGIHYDTLLITTDAVNQIGGYVRIPLQGEQISTPQVLAVMITIEGNNARLTWAPITESIYGCPVTVTAYLVFFSEEYAGPYWFHGLTTDTTYVHAWAVRYADGMFYDVIAITDPLSRLDNLVPGRAYTREEVLQRITN